MYEELQYEIRYQNKVNSWVGLVYRTGIVGEQKGYLKVIVDLRGCLPENLSYARRFRGNNRKVYINGKLIKHRI